VISEQPQDYSEWVAAQADSKWAAQTLRLFLTLHKSFTKINKWCKWPESYYMQDHAFFLKAAPAIEDEVDDFENYLTKQAQEFGLESITGEKLARLECLLLQMGVARCRPDCSESDFGLGQFLMFVVRNAFDYLGLLETPNAVFAQRLCLFKQKHFL
jgi:hypothetical protein